MPCSAGLLPCLWSGCFLPAAAERLLPETESACAATYQAPKRGKGGTLQSRQALLHAATHIENWAVDLSWDVVARFGLRCDEYALPKAFFDDFVTVCTPGACPAS